MKRSGYILFFTALLVICACAAGCTSPKPAAQSTQAPQAPAATPVVSATPAATAAARTADIDTVITVRYNDFACLDVQKELGKTYLYPDEKYRLTASSPGVAGVNVNVIFVDENDSLGVRQIKPQWDSIKKIWVYEGIVPLVQFNDITAPQEKTFTIKTQSKYYICVDDRKETGVNDAMLRVPVKLLKL